MTILKRKNTQYYGDYGRWERWETLVILLISGETIITINVARIFFFNIQFEHLFCFSKTNNNDENIWVVVAGECF